MVGAAEAASSGLYTLPTEFISKGTAPYFYTKLKSRYFMLQVRETANPEKEPNTYGWELAEICLLRNGERVNWPQGIKITCGGGNVSANSSLMNLVDNVIREEQGANNTNPNTPAPGRTFFTEVPSYVMIDAGEEIVFDSYSFVSTSPYGTFTAKLPKAWNFSVCTDGDIASFTTIDSVGSYAPGTDYAITQAYQQLGPFNVASRFPVLDGLAGNSIGDRSPVSIAEEATLKLDTPYEVFGPLSGSGTLDLGWFCTGGINAYENATFSGRVSGCGTLVICGTGTQTFDGAKLAGVRTLQIASGTIVGTASFEGCDVTVSFRGGAVGAALSDIGHLAVSGNVKYAVPPLPAEAKSFSATIFSASFISAESKSLLESGEFCGELRKNWKYGVTVTDTSVIVHGHARGTIVVVR